MLCAWFSLNIFIYNLINLFLNTADRFCGKAEYKALPLDKLVHSLSSLGVIHGILRLKQYIGIGGYPIIA